MILQAILASKGTTEDQKYIFFRHIHPTHKTKFHQSGILGEGGGGKGRKGTSIVRDFFVLSFRRVAAAKKTESIDADCPRSPANIKGPSFSCTLFRTFLFLSFFFKVITLSLSHLTILHLKKKKKRLLTSLYSHLAVVQFHHFFICVSILSPSPSPLPLPSCQLCCTVNPLFSTVLLDTSFTLTHLLHSSHFIYYNTPHIKKKSLLFSPSRAS